MITLLSEPTTAKGMISFGTNEGTLTRHKCFTYTNGLVELHFFLISVLGVEWVKANAVVHHLLANLHDIHQLP